MPTLTSVHSGKRILRVAFVSHDASVYSQRLLLGALAYANTHSHILIRNFQPTHQSLNANGANHVPPQLSRWKPDGVLCMVEIEALEKLIPTLSPPCPIINMASSKIIIPGVVCMAGSLACELKLAIQHLRQQGLHSFGYLDVANNSQGAAELFKKIVNTTSQFQSALIEPIEAALVEDPSATVTPIPPRLVSWLQNLPKPVGIFCRSFGGGGYLIRVCNELGLRVPEDVAIIGEDDVDFALASSPTLTTVLPVAERIGQEAMRLLHGVISGQQPLPTETIRLDAFDLQVRESTGLKLAEVCDIAAALNYIKQNAHLDISVEQVIKETQRVSRATFHKHFLTATGQTPGEAIQQRRLEKSRHLLASTKLSLTTIAGQCGFDNSSNFARNFRLAEGMSPRDYRKKVLARN